MNNVVSIFNKKRKVPEPSQDVEHYLKESLTTVGFTVVSGFEKRWDQEANLWRLEVQVKHHSKAPQQMAFWYDGDDPQFAMEASVGAEFHYQLADRVVKAHERS